MFRRFYWILLVSTVVVDSQECPSTFQQIASMSVDFGGISAFYDISTGISNGLQSSPNNKTYQDIKSLIGNDPVSTTSILQDLIWNQIGSIIFWSIGFVILLAAFVLLVITACWQCCFTCSPKGERTTFGGIFYSILIVTSFAFLLTALILFNISFNQLSSGIQNGGKNIEQITNDINQVVSSGSSQFNCTIHNVTDQLINTSNILLQNYSTSIVDGTSNQIGLTALQNFNTGEFSRQNEETRQFQGEFEKMVENLNKCQASQQYQPLFDEMSTNLKIFTKAAEELQQNSNFIGLQKTMEEVKTTIQAEANSVSSNLNSSAQNIYTQTDDITSQISKLQNDISNFMNSLNRAQSDIVESSLTTTLQLIIGLFINLLASIQLFLSLFNLLTLLYILLCSNDRNRFLRVSILISFYISIIIAILLLPIASAMFVGGWVTSAICVPLFGEPNYKLFQTFNVNLQSPYNTNSQFNVGVALSDCESSSETLYNAINGSQMFSADTINNQIDLSSYQSQTDQSIKQIPFVPFDYSFDELNKSLEIIEKTQKDIINVDLSACNSSQNYETARQLRIVYLQSLNLSVTESQKFYQLLNYFSVQSNNLTTITIDENDQEFDQISANLNQSINSLMNSLQTDIFKCRPIIDILKNSGDVTCSQLGMPINGLWASIGLLGIFSLISSILLLATYRWMLKTHVNYSESESSSSNGRSSYGADEVVFPALPRVQISTTTAADADDYYCDSAAAATTTTTKPRGLKRCS